MKVLYKFKIKKYNSFNLFNFKTLKRFSDKINNNSNLIPTNQNNQIAKNSDYFKSDFFDDKNENIGNKINNQINQNIFDKIFQTSQENDEKQTKDNINVTNLINFTNTSELLDSNNKFTTTLERTVDVKENIEFSELILENKLDFTKEKIQVKNMNLADQELNEDVKQDLYEIELGKIKSFPKLNVKLNEDQLNYLRENQDYEYDISILGKKVNLKDENINLNNYLVLNEDNKHYISPIIFHDEVEDKKGKVKYEDTVFASMLKNPIILILFVIFGYYIYPTLWKKEYFMALSEDYNNREILKAGRLLSSSEIYDYINYRRGLYVSVRSNFS